MKSTRLIRISFTIFSTLIIAPYIPFEICAVVGVLVFIGAVIATVILRKKESLFPTILFSSALALGLICAFYNLNVKDVKALDGSTHIVEAHLLNEPEYTDEKVIYKMKADSVSDTDIKDFKFLVTSYADLGFSEFDSVQAEITFCDMSVGDYYSENIFIRAYIGAEHEPTVSAGNGGLYRYAIEMRSAVRGAVQKYLNGDEGAMITSMLFGDRSGLSDSAYFSVRNSGISHITVVSGLHISILSWLILAIFVRLLRSRRIAAVMTIPFILGLMALAGFTPSVVRAGITSIICFCGSGFFKRSYSLNSLAIAVLVQCVINPFSVCSISFLLTVFSTLGLIFIEPKLSGWIKSLRISRFKILRGVLSVAAVSISAQLMTMPISIIYFGYVNPLAVITNVLVSGWTTFLICVAALGVALIITGVFSFVGSFLLFIAGVNARIILFTAEVMSKISLSHIYIGDGLAVLLCAVVSVAVMSFFFIKRRRIRIISLVSVLVIELLIIVPSLFFAEPILIKVYGLPSGSAVLISDGGRNVLIGCSDRSYGAKSVASALRSDGTDRLDMVILPTDCDLYSKGATTLFRYIEADRVMYDDERIDLMALDGTKRIGYANCEMELTDNVAISINDDGIMITAAKTKIFVPTRYGVSDNSVAEANIIIGPDEFISTTFEPECVIMLNGEVQTKSKPAVLSSNGTETYLLSETRNVEISVTDGGYRAEYYNIY